MSDGGYKINFQDAPHFITFATVGWVDLFTRPNYAEILFESIRYCQLEKALKLHGWCLMTNHIHLLMSSGLNDLSGLLRDFKKFTSYKLISEILKNHSESRSEWMLPIFRSHGTDNSRNRLYQVWQQDNQPKLCYSPKFTMQKLNYMHENPVKAGIVELPEHYNWSSAKDYKVGKKCGLLDITFI